jgi:hypothetical protein
MKRDRHKTVLAIAALAVVSPILTCDAHRPEAAWPHEPPELPLLSDYGFNDGLPVGSGLSIDGHWHINNALSLAGQVTDFSAPASAPLVAQLIYPPGFADGSAPATIYINPEPVREAYFAFVWKASNPFDSHPSQVNKIAFMFPAGENGDIFIMMHRNGAGYEICTEPEFAGDTRALCPNIATTPIVPGRWHRVEWYVKYNSTPGARDGVSQWWVDGVLNGDFRDIQLAGERFVEFQFSPTYGGNTGAVKAEADYFRFDHVHLSGR